jgi:TPR repeat protein
VKQDDARAVAFFQQGCNGREQPACSNLAFMYAAGRGVPKAEGRPVSGCVQLRQLVRCGLVAGPDVGSRGRRAEG